MAAVRALGTATTRMPAARAAVTPWMVSSMAAQSGGSAPSRDAVRR
jgi:hypothetical protein